MKQPAPIKAVKAWAILRANGEDFVTRKGAPELFDSSVDANLQKLPLEKVIPVHIVPVTGEEE